MFKMIDATGLNNLFFNIRSKHMTLSLFLNINVFHNFKKYSILLVKKSHLTILPPVQSFCVSRVHVCVFTIFYFKFISVFISS